MPPRKREPRKDGVVALVPDVITEDDRPYEAYHLKNKGHTWRQVAAMVGYADEENARLSVAAYIQRAAVTRSREQREEVLQMQMDRLDDLYLKAYTDVENGETKMIDTCVRIIAQVSRLWQLEDTKEKTTNNTIVVTEAEFAETLKAHVLGRSG